jgi:methyl-accepting chemotaxis protein
VSAARHAGLRQSVVNRVAAGTLVVLTGLLVLSVVLIDSAVHRQRQAHERRAELKALGLQLQAASDF